MTRRERAAMQLALEMLRGTTVRRWDEATLSSVFDILVRSGRAWLTPAPELREMTCALPWWVVEDGPRPTSAHLIRARLALYLRARLRAERGGRGPRRYRPTGRRCRNLRHNRDRHGRCRHASCGCYVCHRRITPLWQQAPAHGHWRHRCFRCGLTTDVPRGEACEECGERDPRRAKNG